MQVQPDMTTTPTPARVRGVSPRRGDNAALIAGLLLTLGSLLMILLSARSNHAREQAVSPAEVGAPAGAPSPPSR